MKNVKDWFPVKLTIKAITKSLTGTHIDILMAFVFNLKDKIAFFFSETVIVHKIFFFWKIRVYRKNPKISDTRKICCNHPKI